MLTQDQLDMRKSGLGGSDIAAALGCSPWKTQVELWAEKTGAVEGPEPNSAMEWGSRLETAIIEKFIDDHGFEFIVSPCNKTQRHEEHDFLLATPDATIVDAEERKGIFEAKTSGQQPWDDVPPHYLFQIQHYMYVTGSDFAYVGALFRGSEYREYGPFYLSRDWYAQEIVPKLKQFWTSVQANDPSQFPIMSMSDLALLKPVDKGLEPLCADTPEVLAYLDAYSEAKKTADSCVEVMDSIKLEIAKIMGDHPKLVDTEGRTLVTQTQTDDTKVVDGKRLKAEEPEIFDKYSKTRKGYRSMRFYV